MKKTIKGYRRPDGSVGIRNYVLILPGLIMILVAARLPVMQR